MFILASKRRKVMTDEIKKQIHNIHENISNGLSKIKELNKVVPALQSAEEMFAWMEESVNDTPNELSSQTDETLLDYLDKTSQLLHYLNDIPPVPQHFSAAVSSTSGSPSVYVHYVRRIATPFSANSNVNTWANKTLTGWDVIREKQDRSKIVRQRLIQLNSTLGDLHQKCIDSSLAAKVGTQNPIEAAAVQNRLLEQFKGHLIDKCRKGRGATYNRISETLAIDTPLTKMVVADGQDVYNRLNTEYVNVRKVIGSSTGDRLVELLKELEDHIFNITTALDPAKAGITFYTG
jgi:ribosomal protein L17